MNCVVDFSEELSRLTLSEYPNSLFEFPGEASQHLHDAEVMPSEVDSCALANSGSSRITVRKNRSSSSGFLKTEPASATIRHTVIMNGLNCADQEASCERPSRSAVVNPLLNAELSNSAVQQKSVESSSPSVKSWAAVLAAGKNTQRQPASSSAVGGSQSNQPKLSKSLSLKNMSVNRPFEVNSVTKSQANKSHANKSPKSTSVTRVSDRTQLSSDGAENRTKSNDRMSGKHGESQSAAWITVSSHDRKTKSKSQTRHPHSDALGSYMAVKPNQDKQEGEITRVFDGTAASSSQSQATKQKKKKKKKKSKAIEEMSNVVERTEVALSHPAPEFHNLNEFPSLFSLKSGSKKTPLQTSTVNMSGIFIFCLMYHYHMCSFIIIHCDQKERPLMFLNYNSGISWSIFMIFIPM